MERLHVFQERLLLARRRRQMSQGMLAARTALFPTDISKYERGQSMPSLPRLVRLSEALEISADYLLGLTTDPTPAHRHRDADPLPPRSMIRRLMAET